MREDPEDAMALSAFRHAEEVRREIEAWQERFAQEQSAKLRVCLRHAYLTMGDELEQEGRDKDKKWAEIGFKYAVASITTTLSMDLSGIFERREEEA